jgi:hypothetical protein
LRVPALSCRLGAVIAAVLMTAVVVAVAPTDAAAATPRNLTRFKTAVGSVESGGRYDARNPRTGAYGKYQILASKWPTWARPCVGSSTARQTARNQERVASGKMSSLYRWLGSWRRVAYWWLTGSDRRSGWTRAATRYVERVIAKFHGSASTPSHRIRLIGDRSTSIRYDGRWRLARHDRYLGGTVRYATGRGATATLTFTGRSVTWYGPTGPTRGKAKVYIDDKLVRTVDLRRATFQARAVVYTKRWSTSRTHTIRIVTLGTSGRAMVAIDDFGIVR